ncbi:mitochondrial carrier domain-containing protein [Aspergillus terricola var. indicus]
MQNTALDIWLSGAVAVVTVDFLVYPFDTLKTRVQSPHYAAIYKDAATNTIKKSVLFRGLYQGVVSVVLSTIPASGAFFTTYETVKSTLNQTKQASALPFLQSVPAPAINAVSSSAGEMVSCLLLTPAEVIKQNAQVINNVPSANISEKPKQGGTSVTLQVLSRFKQQPWKLWSGYSALVGRNLPFTGINFPIFEAIKGHLVERRHRQQEYTDHSGAGVGAGKERGTRKGGQEPVYERAVLTGIAASISGSIASVITTPIDVIKTRMMLAASGNHPPSSASGGQEVPKKQGSIWTVGNQIFKDEGMKGLFRGGAIRVVWTAISLSIYLSMYEGGKFFLEKRRKRKAEQDT